jgi:hypothetical protein
LKTKGGFFFLSGGDQVEDYLGEGGNYALRLILVKRNFGLFVK